MMSFVSPRKLDRIRSYDSIYRDLRAGALDIWEFCDAVVVSEPLKTYLHQNCPSDIEGSNEYSISHITENPALLQDLCDVIIKNIRQDTEAVYGVHSRELNRYYSLQKQFVKETKKDVPLRKIRPSSLSVSSMPFVPKKSFSSASSPLPMECSSERMIELSHRMDQGLRGDCTPAISSPVPSTPPRRVSSSFQSSFVSTPPQHSGTPTTPPQHPIAPSTPPQHLAAPTTPPQHPIAPSTPPSTPPRAPSTPVHSNQPSSITPHRFSFSNHRCNESEEEIISVAPVHPDQLLIIPSIHRISLLYAAITFSPYSQSLLSQLDLLLKLLQCGLFITYSHDRWLASFEPWRSLPQLSEPMFLQPVNVFQFACQSLTMIREMTAILPPSMIDSLQHVPVVAQFIPELLPSLPFSDPFPDDFFTPCSADQLHLQRLSTESKLSYISPQEQSIFINRQKVMDWVLGLSRAYDECVRSVSMKDLEQLKERMKNEIKTKLGSIAAPENMPFIAHLLLEELFQFTLPSALEILNTPSEENSLRLQTVLLRMRRETTVFPKDLKELEDCMNLVFPEKQGFFAFFMYYSTDSRLPLYLASELTSVITLQHSVFSQQDSAHLLHRIAFQRLAAKLLGFITFSPFWSISQLGSESRLLPVHSFFIPQTVDIIGMAEIAWNSDSYSLFLLWLSQYFYFTTPTLIKRTVSLSQALSCITRYYLSIKGSLKIHDLVIQVLTEEIYQLTGVSSSDFLPLLSIPETITPSFLTSRSLLFLLQSFSEAFGDLLTTSSSTVSILENPRGNVIQNSTRKIRPRDVNLIGEISRSGDPLYFVMENRSQNLLESFASQHSQEYEFLRVLTIFLLQQEGRTITTESINLIMKKEYPKYEEFVSSIYEENEPLDPIIATPNIETNFQLLQTHVESIILKDVSENVSKHVCEEGRVSLLTLSYFQDQGDVWTDNVLHMIVLKERYTVLRDIIHWKIARIFEEGRKQTNLIRIHERYAKNEIAKHITEYNEDSNHSVGVRTSLQLVVHIRQLMKEILEDYQFLQQQCYALFYKKRFLEFVNNGLSTCIMCLKCIYSDLPNSVGDETSLHTLISTIPSLLSDSIVYFPQNDQLKQLLKELCRITLRLHSLGIPLTEPLCYHTINKTVIRALSDAYKQRALAIYLLYLIKPQLLSNDKFSHFLLNLWHEVEVEGKELITNFGQFIVTMLEIYYSETFKRIFPSLNQGDFLMEVVNVLFVYWEGEETEALQRLKQLSNEYICIL